VTQHQELAAGRWGTFTLAEQLANVGSEVSRAARWQGRDDGRFQSAVERGFELLDLTLADARWRTTHRLKELARLRELFAAATLGLDEYATSLQDLDRYLLPYAVAARSTH
jgi:hypothetical protein